MNVLFADGHVKAMRMDDLVAGKKVGAETGISGFAGVLFPKFTVEED